MRLSLDPDALAAPCCRYRIRRLSLFGSELKGTVRPGETWISCSQSLQRRRPAFSIRPGRAGLFALPAGRRVDEKTAADLSRYYGNKMLKGIR